MKDTYGTLVAAMMDYFNPKAEDGTRETSLGDYREEYNALTESDKEDFRRMFADIGVSITPAKKA